MSVTFIKRRILRFNVFPGNGGEIAVTDGVQQQLQQQQQQQHQMLAGLELTSAVSATMSMLPAGVNDLSLTQLPANGRYWFFQPVSIYIYILAIPYVDYVRTPTLWSHLSFHHNGAMLLCQEGRRIAHRCCCGSRRSGSLLPSIAQLRIFSYCLYKFFNRSGN